MSTFRKLVILLGFVLFALIAAVFAYGNRQSIALDLGFVRIEEVSMAGAFASAFVIGALFGMLCAGFGYLKASAERRQLRRRLTAAEAEVARLRSAPLKHAD